MSCLTFEQAHFGIGIDYPACIQVSRGWVGRVMFRLLGSFDGDGINEATG